LKNTATRYLTQLVNKLRDNQQIEYTIPSKPNSRLQKYKITEFGSTLLKKKS